jgi:cytochrome c oxidase subunit 2
LWFDGLGFLHPVNARQRAKSAAQTASGSKSRQAVAVAPGFDAVQGQPRPNRLEATGARKQMPTFSRLTACALIVGSLFAGATAAMAGIGQPSPWQIGLQDAASPVMVDITWFHNFLLWIIFGIALFVLVLLVVVMVRFNARANPTPSRTTHNALIEVLWTIVPVIILVAIAIPSFRLLFVELDVPKPDVTVKATGKQWYWTYDYPDNGNFEFDSLIVEDKDLKPGQPRLLTVDNEMVVPVNKVVHVLVTGADVIHSFAVPSFGIKIDAVPGRLNDTWFKATSEGRFHGQCSELCGKDHAFMPITVHVVSSAEFAAWVAQERKTAGLDNASPNAVAAAGAAH